MSKRFGRNQRRRAREALAAAQETVKQLEFARRMDAALLADQSRTIDRLRSMISEIAYIVGHHAVIAGEPTVLTYGFDGMRAAPDRGELVVGYGPSGQEAPSFNAITAETLRLLKFSAIRDELARHIHFRVSLADGNIGYAISMRAIESMPADALERLLAVEISRDMSRSLVGFLRDRGAT